MDVDVSAVHRRESGMEPFEVMTSESQERMLAIVGPDDLDGVLSICARWEVQASVVGRVTSDGSLRIVDGFDGPVLAEVPASTLHDDAPLYDRPKAPPAELAAHRADEPPPPQRVDCSADLLRLLADTSWVYRQYDHQLFLNTVIGPGGDATLLRLRDPASGAETGRALGLSVDGNHRWCAVDPRSGTAMILAESVMNLACVGARPLCVVNCLNFGNPEHPVVMWQLSEAIDGLAEACRSFDLPVVGGNVSLYNESNGSDIDPTPVVGVLGIRAELAQRPPGLGPSPGDHLFVVGPPVPPDTPMGGSRWAWDVGDHRRGRLPDLDLEAVADTARLVSGLVCDGLLSAVHDVGDGGLAVALAEMVGVGGVGLVAAATTGHRALFAEVPGRAVVATGTDHRSAVIDRASAAGVEMTPLGQAGGDRLVLGDVVDLTVDELTERWRRAIPDALGAPTTSG